MSARDSDPMIVARIALEEAQNLRKLYGTATAAMHIGAEANRCIKTLTDQMTVVLDDIRALKRSQEDTHKLRAMVEDIQLGLKVMHGTVRNMSATRVEIDKMMSVIFPTNRTWKAIGEMTQGIDTYEKFAQSIGNSGRSRLLSSEVFQRVCYIRPLANDDCCYAVPISRYYDYAIMPNGEKCNVVLMPTYVFGVNVGSIVIANTMDPFPLIENMLLEGAHTVKKHLVETRDFDDCPSPASSCYLKQFPVSVCEYISLPRDVANILLGMAGLNTPHSYLIHRLRTFLSHNTLTKNYVLLSQLDICTCAYVPKKFDTLTPDQMVDPDSNPDTVHLNCFSLESGVAVPTNELD
jgi:hypothetical protein